MELEFDKEIDAILRKTPVDRGVLVGDDPPEPKKHLDADTIAAFAENALPQKTKLLYMEHLADCDRCRRMLSQTIVMSNEAVAATASPSVIAEVAKTPVPWYQGIFRSSNLALVMGALVLTLSGILGYFAIRERAGIANTEVSGVTEPQPEQGGPYYGGEADQMNTNAAMPAAPGTFSTANAAANTSTVAGNTAANAIGRADAPESISKVADEKEVAREEPSTELAKSAAPPPAATGAGQPRATPENKPDSAKLKAEDKDLSVAEKRAMDDRLSRDAVPAPMKKIGPNRAAGPRNNQQESQLQSQNIYNEGSTRSVGGKTFDNRGGVWYDISYRGQGTNNVRRGSDDYKKLDGGLRNIAESLSGVVVVVWKSKAYRIQ